MIATKLVTVSFRAYLVGRVFVSGLFAHVSVHVFLCNTCPTDVRRLSDSNPTVLTWGNLSRIAMG